MKKLESKTNLRYKNQQLKCIHNALRQTFGVKAFLLLGFAFIIFATSLQARFATQNDATFEILEKTTEINVKKDGSHESLSSSKVLIKNERARGQFGTLRYTYNADNQMLDVIYARVTVNGKTYDVKPESIERKPVASNLEGFDDIYQVIVSFPRIQPGAILEISTKFTQKKSILENQAFFETFFGQDEFTHKTTYVIHSEIPLFEKVYDPQNHLELKKEHVKKAAIDKNETEIDLWTYKVSLKKPIYASLVNESGDVFFPKDLETGIQFTSLEKHGTLGSGLGEPYEKELSLEIHEELKQLIAAVLAMENGQDKGVQQINLLTSKLADRVRYMGDWRTVDGRFKPRPIKDVMKTGYGDCKDYATMLCKCLRELGYKSNVALIIRGDYGFMQAEKLPTAYAYNHAITYVELPDGTSIFVDPTNFVSMAQIIFPDITDRNSLILDGKASRLLKTPDIQPHQNLTTRRFNYEILADKAGKQVKTEIDMLRIGISALSVTGIGLVQPRQMIIDRFIRSLSKDPDPKIIDLTLPDLTSRIVEPVFGKLKMVTTNNFLRSSRGYGVFLGSSLIDNLFSIKNDQEGDIFLGSPMFTEYTRVFNNRKDDQADQQSIEIHSPWISYIRTVTKVGDDLHIKEQQIVHEKMLTAKDYKSKLFADFKEKLREQVYQYIYILNS